jgi:hypothetical protein
MRGWGGGIFDKITNFDSDTYWSNVKNYGGWGGERRSSPEFVGPMPRNPLTLRQVGRFGFQGAFSAVLPIETIPDLPGQGSLLDQAWGGIKKLVGPDSKVLASIEKATPSGLKQGARAAGRAVSRWLGPVFTGYRLATEVPGKGVAGGAWHGARVVAEEMAYSGMFAVGMSVGTAFGGPIGGLAAGIALGTVGQAVAGAAFDVAGAPIRAVQTGYKYLRARGKAASRLELGGRTSAGNMTRYAYTMRQRALAQMNRSGINARNMLGGEASMMHIR